MVVPVSAEFKDIQFPGLAVDTLLFTIIGSELCVALIKRQEEPYFGKASLPGRFVRYDEPVSETAKKTLELKAGINKKTVDTMYLEQLFTFGDEMKRDTRIRTVSIVYYGIIRHAESVNSSKMNWTPIDKIGQLAFDHNTIVDYALQRLKTNIVDQDVAFHFLDDEFTLTQLQRVHEVILDKEIDKRNFRKKILDQKIIKATPKTIREGPHRPATLYVRSTH